MKFVKLGVADPNNGGEPLFFRRIPLGIEASRNGVSFLKRHAVLLARGEETGDIRNVNLNDYAVVLYYTDLDGDKILVCNDNDVQYAMQGIQGVTASVKITAKVDAKPTSESTKATQTATVSTTETGTQEPAVESKAPSATANLVGLDALGEVLNCVVASANAAMASSMESQQQRSGQVDPPISKTDYPGRPRSTINQAARTSSEALKMALEQAAVHSSKATHLATKATQYAEKKVDKALGKAEKHVNKAVEKAEQQLAKTERKIEEALAAISAKVARECHRSTATLNNDLDTAATEETSKEAGDIEPMAFIHGRHTCDACLTTPILGDRYHATNLLDYDLCAKCHDQYQGSEIKFEVATLDRDASMQDRWRRKYARMNHTMDGANGHHGRGCQMRRSTPRSHFARRGPPPHGPPQHVPPHHGHPAHSPPPHGPPLSYGPGPWNSAHLLARDPCDGSSSSGYKDVSRTHGVDFLTPSHVDLYNDAALEQALRRSLDDLGFTATTTLAVERASAPMEEEVYEVDIAAAPSKVPPTTASDTAVVVETVAPEETCDEEASLAEAAPAVEDLVTAAAAEDAAVAASRAINANAHTEETAVEIPVMFHDCVDKIPSVRAEPHDSREYETVTEAGETIVSGKSGDSAAPSSPKVSTSNNTSFIEQDSSSVENFLGETLDRVANAIDNLMIVDGAEDEDDDEENESQSSWSVVNDDANLARAAEMIGSALFHSDNNVGSTISSVSSAPTHVTNIVNQAQYRRWSYHLERLHELGFGDDAKNIAVLEMLMATNIGVDAFDEDVTLEQVVNALMNEH